MDINKIREKVNYYYKNYDEYLAIIIAMELDWLDLSDEELELAIMRIKFVYNHFDYSTIEGAAISYAEWFNDLKEGNLELEEDENQEDNWKTWYSYSDWK